MRTWTCQRPWKSRLSAPQLQAQLSRLTGRTRLRRLKSTLFSKGAWQQVTRIGDLCHTHVSHKWLSHLDAGSVLTPRDIANVQKEETGRRQDLAKCRLCGSFVDTHNLNMQPRGRHAGTLRMRLRRVVWTQNSQTQAPPRNPAQHRHQGRPIFSPPLLSPDVAPPWMLQQPEETRRRRRLVGQRPIARVKCLSACHWWPPLDGGIARPTQPTMTSPPLASQPSTPLRPSSF